MKVFQALLQAKILFFIDFRSINRLIQLNVHHFFWVILATQLT